MSNWELLDEQVISQRGPFERIKRWWRGVHPERGKIVYGWSGWETVEEKDRIRPLRIIEVPK